MHAFNGNQKGTAEITPLLPKDFSDELSDEIKRKKTLLETLKVVILVLLKRTFA